MLAASAPARRSALYGIGPARVWFTHDSPADDGAGVEQVEAPALRVLLGLGPGLGGDDGDVAAGRRGVGEPGRQQRGLDTPAAVRGRGRRAGELRDALGDADSWRRRR